MAEAFPSRRQAQADPPAVRAALIAFTVGVIGLLIVVPLIDVFVEAFANGVGAYWQSLVGNADTRQSILLTLTVAPIAVGANLVFGVTAAGAIARFRFPGRTLLTALIDLPFSVSPVVVGLFLVLLVISFSMLILVNLLESWSRRHGA